MPPGRGHTPGSLIETFAGLHLRGLGGWIAVADLIRLLAAADIGAPAVRQALVRIKSRGLLAAQTRDGTAGYLLTAAGSADLDRGDARIFRYGQADAAQGWVLAVFSVPESERAARHRLRGELTWLGFGTVAPGVWVAPAALARPARSQLRDAGLDHFVTWFAGQALDPAPVADWWDLTGLAGMYQDFLASWTGALHTSDPAAEQAAGPAAVPSPPGDGQSFAAHLQLVDHWRQFPRLDPGLPVASLPADWPGARAWQVFSTLHARWAGPAALFVDSVVHRAR